MKSLQELINDADDIQKRLTQHKVDLYEYAESLNENHVVDIDRLMMKASHCKIERHILQDIDDEYVIGAYLQLLLSVAQVNVTDDNGENHPILYACRIAAALPKIPDMKMALKKSTILAEREISENTDSLIQHKLADIFIFDALMLMCTYDTKDEGRLEYIAELAMLLGITENALNEILMIVQAATNLDIKLDCAFQFINIDAFIGVLQQFRGKIDIHIETYDYFIESHVKPISATSCNLNLSTIQNKKYVELYNILFDSKSDNRHQRIYINHCDYVYITNCIYKNCLEHVINISNCNEVLIRETRFKDIEVHGAKLTACLMLVQNINTVCIDSCIFDNVAQFEVSGDVDEGRYNNTGIIMIAQNVSSMSVINSSFSDCYIKYFDNGIVTKYFIKKLLYGLESDEVKYLDCKFHNSCELI